MSSVICFYLLKVFIYSIIPIAYVMGLVNVTTLRDPDPPMLPLPTVALHLQQFGLLS